MITGIDRVVNTGRNSMPPLPSRMPPILSPFPKALHEGHTIDLAYITTKLRSEASDLLLLATVNWSVTFPGNAGGWAEVTFEILRGKAVIYTVHQSVVQGENNGSVALPLLTVFNIASLKHIDPAPLGNTSGKVTYRLKATNNIIFNPAGAKVSAHANFGAVTFTAQEITALSE